MGPCQNSSIVTAHWRYCATKGEAELVAAGSWTDYDPVRPRFFGAIHGQTYRVVAFGDGTGFASCLFPGVDYCHTLPSAGCYRRVTLLPPTQCRRGCAALSLERGPGLRVSGRVFVKLLYRLV